jgi:hypothetical protein
MPATWMMLLVSRSAGIMRRDAPLSGRLSGLGQLLWSDRDGVAGENGWMSAPFPVETRAVGNSLSAGSHLTICDVSVRVVCGARARCSPLGWPLLG